MKGVANRQQLRWASEIATFRPVKLFAAELFPESESPALSECDSFGEEGDQELEMAFSPFTPSDPTPVRAMASDNWAQTLDKPISALTYEDIMKTSPRAIKQRWIEEAGERTTAQLAAEYVRLVEGALRAEEEARKPTAILKALLWFVLKLVLWIMLVVVVVMVDLFVCLWDLGAAVVEFGRRGERVLWISVCALLVLGSMRTGGLVESFRFSYLLSFRTQNTLYLS